MGRKVYVWSNRVWMPDSATTTYMTGKVGGKPFTATSTTYGGNGGHDVICELRLIAGDNDVIERYQYDGDGLACLRFSAALNPLRGR